MWNDKVVSLNLYMFGTTTSLFDQIKSLRIYLFLVVHLYLIPPKSFLSTFYLFLNDNANIFFSKKNIRRILD